MKAKEIRQNEFDILVANANAEVWEHIGEKPTVVDFYASWCGPCKALTPILDEVTKEYEGRINVYKVNVDEDPELTTLFNIRTVPTLLFSKPGIQTPIIMLGVMGKAELKQRIEELLLN